MTWTALGISILALGLVIISSINSKSVTTGTYSSFQNKFISQESNAPGTCYLFSDGQESSVNNVSYLNCTKKNTWYQFCQNKYRKGDQNCRLAAVEKNNPRTKPDYDDIPLFTRGWCQLVSPDQVIKNTTFVSCLGEHRWVHFAYGGKNIAYRWGETLIKYGQNGLAKLQDTKANCYAHPNRTEPPICTNSILWQSYDDKLTLGPR